MASTCGFRLAFNANRMNYRYYYQWLMVKYGSEKVNLKDAMPIPFKSSPIEFDQHLLFPSNVFDLLPKDHECYIYMDLFEQLSTSSLESEYSRKGQNAYHPKRIVAILIYAYSRGVFSSRQIQRRCNEDLQMDDVFE